MLVFSLQDGPETSFLVKGEDLTLELPLEEGLDPYFLLKGVGLIPASLVKRVGLMPAFLVKRADLIPAISIGRWA